MRAGALKIQSLKVVKPAYKPGSVEDSHSSRRPVTWPLKQPTREQREPRHRSPIWSCSGWGLTCRFRCRLRGALLPHLFTLAVESKDSLRRFKSLYHFPWPRDLRPLAGIPLYGARTFLPDDKHRGDCPADFTILSLTETKPQPRLPAKELTPCLLGQDGREHLWGFAEDAHALH